MVSTERSRQVILFGTEEPVPEVRRLSAGALTLDLDRGNLRHIRWGGVEVIRAIAFIVRDTKWGTYSPVLSDLDVDEAADAFSVVYRAACESADGAFAYSARIEGRADGHLSFRAEGTSPRGFVTNRTGFIVLHPLEGAVGQDLDGELASGGVRHLRFPRLVDPGIPATDIAGLVHEPRPGLRVAVRMDAEAFEMEDHRNWTDASFKTYVRPLALGYPYRIAPDEPVRQAVTVTIEGPPPAGATIRAEETLVRLGALGGPMPRLGLFVENGGVDEAETVADRVAEIGAAFVTVRLDLRDDGIEANVSRLDRLARRIGAPLALQVVIPGAEPMAELAPLAAAVARVRPELESLLVVPARDLKTRPANSVPPGEAEPAAILAAARAVFPGYRIGGGMPVSFPELNRNRPPAGIDFVTHATQATMHDADDVSVVETLEALPHVIASTRAFVGDIPYRIGPATIGMPATASASSPAANPARGRICMAGEEPRQHGLFAAAFVLGYAATAAGAGIDALSFASPAGPFGLYDAATGAARPIALVVAGLAALSDARRVEATVSGPAPIAALAAESPDGPVLWLANLGALPATLRIDGAGLGSVTMVDAGALAGASADAVAPRPFAGNRVVLDSYAVCRLE